MTSTPLPYKIASLIFIENEAGEQLLLKRKKQPNLGLWTPIGGKLETNTGESPVECALRETREEAGFELREEDLHLFAYVAEAGYEGSSHWLIFLFHCLKPIPSLPAAIDEGTFGFHPLNSFASIPMAASDRDILWPVYVRNRNGFTGIRVKYNKLTKPFQYTSVIEQEIRCPD